MMSFTIKRITNHITNHIIKNSDQQAYWKEGIVEVCFVDDGKFVLQYMENEMHIAIRWADGIHYNTPLVGIEMFY